jgi:hypothetical protein
MKPKDYMIRIYITRGISIGDGVEPLNSYIIVKLAGTEKNLEV